MASLLRPRSGTITTLVGSAVEGDLLRHDPVFYGGESDCRTFVLKLIIRPAFGCELARALLVSQPRRRLQGPTLPWRPCVE